MTKSLFLSLVFHTAMIVLTALSLPFMLRAPLDLPPILSVELIQITDKTDVPYANYFLTPYDKFSTGEV